MWQIHYERVTAALLLPSSKFPFFFSQDTLKAKLPFKISSYLRKEQWMVQWSRTFLSDRGPQVQWLASQVERFRQQVMKNTLWLRPWRVVASRQHWDRWTNTLEQQCPTFFSLFRCLESAIEKDFLETKWLSPIPNHVVYYSFLVTSELHFRTHKWHHLKALIWSLYDKCLTCGDQGAYSRQIYGDIMPMLYICCRMKKRHLKCCRR